MEYMHQRGCSHFNHGQIAGFNGVEAEDHYPPDLGLASKHLEIHLRVSIETEELFLRVIHRIVANRTGVSELVLDGVELENLNVVSVHEGTEPVSFRYDGKKIFLRWQTPFVRGDIRYVALEYKVESPKTGVFFMYPTSEEPSRPLYVATDHETERARYWLACMDFPNLKTTIDWYITAPTNLTVLANGILIAEQIHDDGSKTVHWALKQFCPSYLACFAVGDFIEAKLGYVGSVEIASFATKPFTTRDLELSFSKTGRMLTWMIDKLNVPFPYPKYFQFALPHYSGAMENISLVSWNDQLLCTESSYEEQCWLMDQVNIHEMAHSYFGDLVGCKDFAHVWLKESWATYMETCWLEDDKGQDEMFYDIWRNAKAYFSEADSKYQRPLVTRKYHSSWQLFDNHLYPGGACRLHTLRCEVGDEIFWPAVNEYLVKYQHQVVETDDFRKILEKHSGRSLQRFFDQWIYHEGYPDIKVSFIYEKESGRGLFEVLQKQGSKGSIFHFKTELGWTEVNDGKESHHIFSIEVTKERQTFVVPMAQDPLQVRFDPLCKVLHKLEFDPGASRALAQLSHAPDIIGRIHAAQVIAGTGKPSLLRKILNAYRNEKFWGVRREMIQLIGDVQSQKAVEILLEISEIENDPLVLDKLIMVLGQVRDESVKETLVSLVRKGDLPPRAHSAALLGIGFQNSEDVLELLKEEFARDRSPNKVSAKSALQALGGTHSPLVIDFLEAIALKKRAHFRVKKGAILGLGMLIPFIEPHIAARIELLLIDLLRDEEPWTRDGAVQAMALGKVTKGLGALTAYASHLPLQEQLAIKKVIAELTHLSFKSPGNMEKGIEDLKAEIRKIQGRIQDLEDGKVGQFKNEYK